MSRVAHVDILLELIDLCREIMSDVAQQLVYYRASVYKTETAAQIDQRVEQLRLIVGMLGDAAVAEPLNDYEAMVKNRVMSPVPGECSLTFRVTQLIKGLEQQMQEAAQRLQNRHAATLVNNDLPKLVHEHRGQLLAICRHDSPQRAFFMTV